MGCFIQYERNPIDNDSEVKNLDIQLSTDCAAGMKEWTLRRQKSFSFINQTRTGSGLRREQSKLITKIINSFNDENLKKKHFFKLSI